MKRQNILLILAVLALVIIPLLLVHKPSGGGEIFAGADGQAEELIRTINPDYKPWFSPLFELPSGEIETLLFALQAALGAGFIGFYLGLMKGRAEGKGNVPGKPCI